LIDLETVSSNKKHPPAFLLQQSKKKKQFLNFNFKRLAAAWMFDFREF
jgi:hypothetical protein